MTALLGAIWIASGLLSKAMQAYANFMFELKLIPEGYRRLLIDLFSTRTRTAIVVSIPAVGILTYVAVQYVHW